MKTHFWSEMATRTWFICQNALIVVDMQVDNEGMCREMDIVEKIVSVMGACHEKGVPVFISQHCDGLVHVTVLGLKMAATDAQGV